MKEKVKKEKKELAFIVKATLPDECFNCKGVTFTKTKGYHEHINVWQCKGCKYLIILDSRLPAKTSDCEAPKKKKPLNIMDRFNQISNEVPMKDDEAEELLKKAKIDHKAALDDLLKRIKTSDTDLEERVTNLTIDFINLKKQVMDHLNQEEGK